MKYCDKGLAAVVASVLGFAATGTASAAVSLSYDFESGSIPSDMSTNTGTDTSVSVATVGGSKALQIYDNTTSAKASWYVGAINNMANYDATQDQFVVAFDVYQAAAASNGGVDLMQIQTSTGPSSNTKTAIIKISQDTDNKLRVFHDATSTKQTSTLPTDTWMQFTISFDLSESQFSYSVTANSQTLHSGTHNFMAASTGSVREIGGATFTGGKLTTNLDNITLTQVPEPTALALLSLAAVPMLRRRRV